jgi:DNA primase
MPRTRWVNYRELKEAVSIEKVLDHYGLLSNLTRRGDSLEGACPIHGGHSPRQFRVSLRKNAYHCFSCNAGGNILDFVGAMEDVEIRAAALLLVNWFKLQRTAVTKRPSKNSLAPAGSPKRRKAPARGADR